MQGEGEVKGLNVKYELGLITLFPLSETEYPWMSQHNCNTPLLEITKVRMLFCS